MMQLDESLNLKLLFSGTSGEASKGFFFPSEVESSMKSFNPISERIMRVDFMTDRGCADYCGCIWSNRTG